MMLYTICLAVGLLFTIVSAIAGHLFDPTVLASFITAFGATGLILSRIEATKRISAPISAMTGLAIAFKIEQFIEKGPGLKSVQTRAKQTNNQEALCQTTQ